MSVLNLATAPAEEPITTAEAKAHLRITHSDDDTYVATLIKVARYVAETITNRAIITQTWDWYLDGFPGVDTIQVPKPALQSVTYIKYTDEDDTVNTLSSDDYVVDIYSTYGRIKLSDTATWPSDTLTELNGVNIRFVAGYGLAADVPEPIKQAVLLLIANWYENREPVTFGKGIPKNVPMSAKYLLYPYRVWGLTLR